MNCDICFELFDHSTHKPFVLIPCTHTLCAECLTRLKTKTCPNCKKRFRNKNPNWILLGLIENNCSNLKNEPREELKKTLDESASLKSSIHKEYEKRLEKSEDTYKLIENQIRSQTTILIKSIESCQSKLLIQLKDMQNMHKLDLDKLFNDNKFNELINTAENLVLAPNSSASNATEIIEINKNLKLKANSLKNSIFEKELDSLEFIINTKSLNYKPEFIGRLIEKSINTGNVSKIEELIQEGKSYEEINDFKLAIECYEKAIQQNETQDDLFYLKGNALKQQGNHLLASECFKKALDLNSNNINYIKCLANALIASDSELDEALEWIDKAIKIDPNDAELFKLKGDTFKEKEMYNESVRFYNRAIEINPNNMTYYLCKVNALFDNDDYKGAIKWCNKLIDKEPFNLEAIRLKGKILVELEQYENAIKCFDQLIQHDPKDDLAYDNKGSALYQLRDNEQAIEYFNKAIELNPNNDDFYHNKGLALRDLDKNLEALECFSKAIELNSDASLTYEYKGDSLVKLQRYLEALECYNKAVELDSVNNELFRKKGDCLFCLGRYSQAIKCFNKSLSFNPNEDIKIYIYARIDECKLFKNGFSCIYNPSVLI